MCSLYHIARLTNHVRVYHLELHLILLGTYSKFPKYAGSSSELREGSGIICLDEALLSHKTLQGLKRQPAALRGLDEGVVFESFLRLRVPRRRPQRREAVFCFRLGVRARHAPLHAVVINKLR